MADDCRRKLRAHKAGMTQRRRHPGRPGGRRHRTGADELRVLPRRRAGREARWRGGSKFYPALVLASSASGTTVDLKYVDDSDEEDDVPVELVRPANRRLLQRYQQCINQIVRRAPDSLVDLCTGYQELTGKRTAAPSYSVAAVAAAALAVVAAIRQGRQMYCALERRAQVCCDRRVWAGENSARVAFEDGALKTVPLEELEPLSTPAHVHPETSRQPKSSRTGSRTDRVTDQAALEAKLREDNWTITEVPRAPGKDGKKPTP